MKRNPSLKLEKSPLVYVLAQVKFSAVLKMLDYVPDIQVKAREMGLSKFDPENVQQVTFGQEMKTESAQRWVFSNRNQRESFILMNDFAVYETSHYDVFETFCQRFRKVVEIVKSHVPIDCAEQIGLRYVDLIRPSEGKTASEFLREQIRGLSSEDLGASQSRHQFVIQAKMDHSDLFVKSFENSGKGFMPPDLNSTHLKFSVDPADDEIYRVLDFDHIFRDEIDFDPDTIEEKLGTLHEVTSKAFKATVTEEAIEYWKGKGG